MAARRETSVARIIETTYTLGQRLPRHAHEHVYMVVLISGALRETALGCEHDMTRGAFVYNAAGEGHHNVVLSHGTRCLNVELRPSFLARLRGEGRRPREDVVYGTAGPAIGAVGRLYSALLDPGEDVEVEEALTELIDAAWGNAETGSPGDRDFSWLPRTLELVRATFRRGVLLDEMAGVAGVHRTHLCRSFRAAVGCTMGEYVRRLRADMAHRRLVESERSPAAVAVECGYADQSHMSRELRRRYGRSPGRLRRPVPR